MNAPHQQKTPSTDACIATLYEELRRIARAWIARESRQQTLQATALVHEAYLRLRNQKDPCWDHPRHFFVAAAESMRRILVEHARRHRRVRQAREDLTLRLGEGDCVREVDSFELLALDDALCALETRDPRAARIVKLRYFAGLSMVRVAEILELSARSAFRDWSAARAWLVTRIEGQAR